MKQAPRPNHKRVSIVQVIFLLGTLALVAALVSMLALG